MKEKKIEPGGLICTKPDSKRVRVYVLGNVYSGYSWEPNV